MCLMVAVAGLLQRLDSASSMVCGIMENKKMLLARRARRAAASQIDTMLHFLEQHAHILRSRHDKEKNEQLWWRLSTLLNTDPSGVRKTPNQWRTVWRDLRYKTTGKNFDLHRNPTETPPFTSMEQQVMKIIGEGLKEGTNSHSENDIMDDNERNRHDMNSVNSGIQSKVQIRRRPKMSASQYKTMLSFMEQHPQFAKGLVRFGNKETIFSIWNTLAIQLNSDPSRIRRSPREWRRIWANLKHKSAMKLSSIMDTPLTNNERRILAIIGRDYASKKCDNTKDGDTIDDDKSSIAHSNNRYDIKVDSKSFSLHITDKNVSSDLLDLKSENILDEDEAFLFSILSSMKRMSEDEKCNFKDDVRNVIRRIQNKI